MDESTSDASANISSANLGSAAARGDEDWQPILQLHLAEYQALTTRITYWITLQYSTAPITGGVLLLLAGVRDILPPILLIWATATIVEIGIGAYFYTIYEMMNNAEYIECRLATSIRECFPNAPPFWQYERYRKGSHVYSPIGIYLMTIPCFGIPCIALWLHWSRWPPLSCGDVVGAIISGSIGAWAIAIARKGSRAQKRLWECAEKAK